MNMCVWHVSYVKVITHYVYKLPAHELAHVYSQHDCITRDLVVIHSFLWEILLKTTSVGLGFQVSAQHTNH